VDALEHCGIAIDEINEVTIMKAARKQNVQKFLFERGELLYPFLITATILFRLILPQAFLSKHGNQKARL
jgi:hypothetical protein